MWTLSLKISPRTVHGGISAAVNAKKPPFVLVKVTNVLDAMPQQQKQGYRLIIVSNQITDLPILFKSCLTHCRTSHVLYI